MFAAFLFKLLFIMLSPVALVIGTWLSWKVVWFLIKRAFIKLDNSLLNEK